MSMRTALAELQRANTELQQTIAELVMTVHEDRPRECDVAAIDDLAEIVSEVQAAAAEAGAAISAVADVRDLPLSLPRIDSATAHGARRYWRDLRSYSAVSRLRTTARGRGIEWRTWQSSVEQSELRCEAPMERSADSVRSAWREIGELLTLYLPSTPGDSPVPDPSEHSAQASASATSMSARRPS
jgi:hypothetical protein